MASFVKTVLSAASGLANFASGVVKIFTMKAQKERDQRLQKEGAKMQQLENAEDINELHEQAADVAAEPPMDKSEQLEWLRKQTGDKDD